MHRLKILEQNRQTVINSAIVAKATVQQMNGRIEQLVVFQESTRHEFYWIFCAEREDTPQNAWRFAGYRGREAGVGDFRPYWDFHSFVDHHAKTIQAKVLHVRVFDARRLAALHTKTHHDSICADWSPQNLSRMSFEMQNKRLASKMKGHTPWSR